jgi:nitrogen regulatory protein P-II 1
MKLVVAVIRPKMLPRLTSALRKAGVAGVTVIRAQGFGREQMEADFELVGILSERVKIEIAIEDDQADKLVKLINDVAGTGKEGDGIIFVWDLLSAKLIDRPTEG